jgi:hypothetical protein
MKAPSLRAAKLKPAQVPSRQTTLRAMRTGPDWRLAIMPAITDASMRAAP